MTEVDEPRPPLPLNTVIVNGAAINLITGLTESLRADMRAMETRMSDDLASRFLAHAEQHSDEGGRLTRAFDRITLLELDDMEDDQLAAARKARREGQLSLFFAARHVATWGEKYGAKVLFTAAILVGLLLTFLSGVKVSIGP